MLSNRTRRYVNISIRFVPLLCLSFFYTNCAPFEMSTDLTSKIPQPPPTFDPELLSKGISGYANNCAQCHGEFAHSTKKGVDFTRLHQAAQSVPQMAFLKDLPESELKEIAYALTATEPEVEENLTGTPQIARTWDSLSAKSCSAEGLGRDIRILDRSQYHDIILDVFGYDLDVASLPYISRDYYASESSSGGTGINDLLHLNALFNIAEKVAAYTGDNLSLVATRFSTCDQGTRACQDQIAAQIVSRLFRRNLDSSDPDLSAIIQKFSTVSDFKTRIKSIVTATLMMPRFLYIVEYKKGMRKTPLAKDAMRLVDDFEMASRMSFMLWNSVPDQQLLDLAQSKILSNPAVLRSQVKRMLADSRAKRFIRKFTTEWLAIDNIESLTKDTGAFPAFSQSLMKRFKTETETFAVDIFDQDRDVRELFTSDRTFVDGALAAHYGVSGVTGTSFVSGRRPQTELHAGILSHGSLSAVTSGSTTDPIHRGIYKYKRFLCGHIGHPPASAGLVVIEGSKLEQLHGRSTMKSCMGCHSKFEPLGFASENLSPLGQFRMTDELGKPTGLSVALMSGVEVASPKDLGTELARNPLIGYCLTQNMTKYGLNGNYQPTDAIRCQTESSTFNAYKNGNRLRDYIEAVVTSPLFNRKLEVR